MTTTRTIRPSGIILALGLLLICSLLGGLAVRPIHYWVTHAKRLAVTLFPNLGARTKGGDYASSDRFIAGLEIDQASETVRAALTDLAADETAVFVAPANDPTFMQTVLTFSYLSWPRQIAVLGCGEAGQPPQQFFQPRAGARVVRAFFYLQAPPNRLAQSSRALGQKLQLTNVMEGDDWTTYCSP
jgi:hypothetical protein